MALVVGMTVPVLAGGLAGKSLPFPPGRAKRAPAVASGPLVTSIPNRVGALVRRLIASPIP